MSIEQPNDYDYRTAQLHGLGAMHGGDPEVLRDLGIPVDAEDMGQHVESGKQVRQLQPTAVQVGRLVGDHERWIDSLNLTNPTTAEPILHRATPEQRIVNTNGVKAAKARILPIGSRPGN